MHQFNWFSSACTVMAVQSGSLNVKTRISLKGLTMSSFFLGFEIRPLRVFFSTTGASGMMNSGSSKLCLLASAAVSDFRFRPRFFASGFDLISAKKSKLQSQPT